MLRYTYIRQIIHYYYYYIVLLSTYAWSSQVSALKDVVEDMLTRLEEFQTFMEMVNNNNIFLIVSD